jgi:Sulfotransferase domain
MLRCFFGRHKSASTWARNIIHETAAALDLKILTVHLANQWEDYPTLGDMVMEKKPDILIMTGPERKDVETLPEYKGVHLIRDPRDIIVSGYFSHRNSHPEVFDSLSWPEMVEHRKRLLELDKDAGIEAEIEFSHTFLDQISSWDFHNPRVLEARMEELTTDQIAGWTSIMTQLDLLGEDGLGRLTAVKWNLANRRGKPWAAKHLRRVLPRVPLTRIPPAYLPNVLDRFSFTRLSKSDRKPGEVDENSHYRKGMARDWENHFTARHHERFHELYGDLVQRLGYE